MKVLVATETRSASAAIGMLIAEQPDLELSGQVADIAALLVKVKSARPDVVVLDWDAFGKRMDDLQELLELFNDPPAIVALSVNEEARAEALACGATGFAYKGDPPSQLLETIRNSEHGHQHEPRQ